MALKLFYLSPLILGPTLLLTGAWRGPLSTSPASPISQFQPQTIPLNRTLIGPEVTGTQFLDRVLNHLAPERTTWLKTQLWQKMRTPGLEFEALGTLQLGLHECARLDLQVSTPTRRSRLLTVSDGHALARVSFSADAVPQVDSALLPSRDDVAARRQFLREKGCGGPFYPLQELRETLRQVRIETGLLKTTPVIRLRGELDPGRIHESLQLKVPARCACVYLDAQTLWPHRIEWWGQDRKGQFQPVVELEYRQPELNRALSHDACARLFSYRPDSDSGERPK